MSCIEGPLGEFLDSYASAFDRQDMNAILAHFSYPCLIITAQNITASRNKAELEDTIRRYSRYLSGGQLEHRTSYTLTSLYPLDNKHLIISLHWQINNRLGQEISNFHCNYHIINNTQNYKIVVVMLPEEKF